MNAQEKIIAKLKDNQFKYKKKLHTFVSCKSVSTYLMIITDITPIQVDFDNVDSFLTEVEIIEVDMVYEKKETVSAVVANLETPNVFQKINSSFEALIDQLDNVTSENLPMLEAKAKMLTSIGQTAVNMENSKREIYKAITGK